MVTLFETEAHIILQLCGIIRVAEEYGGVNRLLFCVLFWVQTRVKCLQGLEMLEDIVGTLDGYWGGVVV